MGLSFTNIPDRDGPAVYLLGDGSGEQERQLTALGEEIDKATAASTQVVYLDIRKGDGLQVDEFYGFTQFPVVAIIMDDDTVYQSWEVTLPPADQVTYALSQVNGSMNAS